MIRAHITASLAVFAAGLSASATAADTRDAVLTRMDQAAASFHAMTASVRHTTYTAVLDDKNVEEGRVEMQKVAAGEIRGLVEFTKPNHKFYLFEKRKLQIYTPKINTVQVFDLGKHGEQLDQFLSIGFGTSGKELAQGYDVSVDGGDTVDGQKTTKLTLVPKTGEAKQYLTKIELWLTADNYPIREKLFEPSGDYVLVDYSDVKINPALPSNAISLHVAPGAKYEYPQK